MIDNRGGAAHVLGSTDRGQGCTGRSYPAGRRSRHLRDQSDALPQGKLPYDTENDFTPITGLIRINQALVARTSLPASNASDLIKRAKHKPNEFTYGTAGVGSGPQMNIVKFENMAGVTLQPIHYRGAAPALNDVMAGHIDLMSISVSLVVQPHQEGKLKILGVGAKKRVSQLPKLPTVAESGLPDYEAVTWFGLVGPKEMPRDLVMKINTEIQGILGDPAFPRKVPGSADVRVR